MCDGCKKEKEAQEQRRHFASAQTGGTAAAMVEANTALPGPFVSHLRVRTVMEIAESVVRTLDGVRVDQAVEALQMAIPLVANQRNGPR